VIRVSVIIKIVQHQSTTVAVIHEQNVHLSINKQTQPNYSLFRLLS